MAEATYVDTGEVILYTTVNAVDKGDVVSLTTRIGIAAEDIAALGTGPVAVEGVYEAPANATLVISTGDAVYWDVDDGNVNKTAENNTPAGWAVEPCGNGDTTVKIKLLG